MKRVKLQTAIEALGFKVVRTINGYNARSYWATKGNEMWYFHIEDLRDANPCIYRRRVKDEYDYIGEANLYDVGEMAKKIGLEVRQPRSKRYDYNQM